MHNRTAIPSLDPVYYDNKANEAKDQYTLDEGDAWFQHPCTRALLNTLRSDYANHVVLLVGGAYSDEDSIDATAQKTAKARGQAQAVEDIIEAIYDFKNRNFEEEEYDQFEN